MKRTLMTTALILGLTGSILAQLRSTPPGGGNQRSYTKQYLGRISYVAFDYNSPDVDGREGQIWGQLVPYGMNNLGFGLSTADNPSPWRAGANENTTVKFSHDMEIQGTAVKAGKYGFHVIPNEDGPWQIILTGKNDVWGSFFYTPEDEILRVEATPKENGFREFLTYEFTEKKVDQVTVELMWENVSLPFTITMPNQNEVILASLESELQNSTGFSWTNYTGAANWASGAGFHDKAIEWAEAGVSLPFIGQANFQTLSTKGAVLLAAGKKEEAMAVMDDAIKHPTAGPFQIHGYGRQLLTQGETDKAMEVFKYNHKTNKGVWPTNYGLARAYSAAGDFKNALKYLKIAKTKVPENDTINPPVIDANIEKLEKGEDIN